MRAREEPEFCARGLRDMGAGRDTEAALGASLLTAQVLQGVLAYLTKD